MQPKQRSFHASQYHLTQAEAFCAVMLANGLTFEQIMINKLGSFKRSYRSDIDKINLVFKNELKQFVIRLSLNRDSIYDRLPEGLFHQSKGNSRTLTTTEKVEEHRRYKEEERNARKFFQPVEQEFFRYAVQIRQEEFDTAFSLLNANLRRELNAFWEFDEDLPTEPVNRLLQIMPWIKSIKGDLALTARVLALMLGREVKASKYITQNHHSSETAFSLGDKMLGIDTVSGEAFWEPFACWRFEILQLSKEEVSLYLPHQPYGKLLRQFEDLFIPLEVDVVFALCLQEEGQSQTLTESVLGYSLML